MPRGKSTSKTRPTTARSARDLARILTRLGTRVSHAAVAKWMRHERWTFGSPPWNVADVLAWRAVTLEPNPAAGKSTAHRAEEPPSEITKSRILLNLRKAELLERQLEILDQEYIKREEHERHCVDIINEIKAAIHQALPRNIAAALGACTSDDARAELLQTTIARSFNTLAGYTPDGDEPSQSPVAA